MANEFLEIDAERAIRDLMAHIRRQTNDRPTRDVVLGLSGGIDSCLLSLLAVEALGKGSVHLTYLYDRYSGEDQHRSALAVSERLGVELREESIEPAMRNQGVYSTFGMRVTSLSGVFNRLLYRAYEGLFGENPFISSLESGCLESEADEPLAHGFRAIIRQPEEGMNARHRYRRRLLEEKARLNGWLPLGAANRSEWYLGWFVKDGIDDLPIQPIKGLYKTQVRQLGRFLQLPDQVIAQSPSPDMVKGIKDEFAIGIPYSKADLALDYLAGGLSKRQVVGAGVNEREIQLVSEMNRLSGWKRGGAETSFPVDGGPDGGLRPTHPE